MRKILLSISGLLFFLALTLPLAFERPAGGRSSERQGATAGIIRIYCQEPSHSVLDGPQPHFGKNPFNLEWTGFEWAQGLLARAIGGEACDAVEPVAKVVSIFGSVLALLVLGLLVNSLWGPNAAAIAALLLGGDELWLRYSTYTMIENRVLLCMLLGIWLSLRRKPVGASLAWGLAFVQKPQIFAFGTALWLGLEFYVRPRAPKKWKPSGKEIHLLLGYGLATAVGLVFHAYSRKLAVQNDLPWMTYTGPRAMHWYLGNWSDRFTFVFWKNLFTEWMRFSGLYLALPIAAIWGAQPRGAGLGELREPLRRALPFLIASFGYKFCFYAVYVVHEYYALPLDVGRSIAAAGVFAWVLDRATSPMGSRSTISRQALRWGSQAAVWGFLLVVTWGGTRKYLEFARDINSPNTDYYYKAWDVNVFPKKSALVVMAPPGDARDLLHLYLTKQRGHMWCSTNPRFAPRAFWKAQGVEYVAWTGPVDPQTGTHQWTVRTMDEELAYARARGWSSDANDVWAGHSMAQWSAIASRGFLHPCRKGQEDPRGWEKLAPSQ